MVRVSCGLGGCYHTICTLIEENVKGEKIGVTQDYLIIFTSIGCLFIFRVVGPGEMSPVTWGNEKENSKFLEKYPCNGPIVMTKSDFFFVFVFRG
jgi:hypothetical protein